MNVMRLASVAMSRDIGLGDRRGRKPRQPGQGREAAATTRSPLGRCPVSTFPFP